MKIGNITYNDDGTIKDIEKEFWGQGYIFKDYDAYANEPNKVCYVPELSDTVYTRNNFVEICKGNEAEAYFLFDMVDWQHPETEYEEFDFDSSKIFES
jgi:hypothetical protein